jgi:hypothetical protein
MLFIAQRVHCLPEAVVQESVEFALCDEFLHRLPLKYLRVVGDHSYGTWR